MNNVISVDPRPLFARLARDLPAELMEHVFVVGSLAAACHYSERMVDGGIQTKDADLVVYPNDQLVAAEEIARKLLGLGWRPKPSEFPPGTDETPAVELPAIRLYPPEHRDYFVELLIVPGGERPGKKPWLRVSLDDGWYGVPSFEFLGLTQFFLEQSPQGLKYAHPAMMALANLLSHPLLDPPDAKPMSTQVGGRDIFRSSKDLGRVLALVRLQTRDETELWAEMWLRALRECFPTRWTELARRVGVGFRALLADDERFDEAWHCCNVGLLKGLDVDHDALRAVAAQLIVDVIEPVEEAGAVS